MKPFSRLDRYVLKQWIGTFILSVVGVPAVAVLIDLSERFDKISAKGVPLRDIFLGQAMLFPSKMAILFPAGALFATVFTLNGMGRHNELTAVKAGGISFYRLIAPLMVMAILSVPANFALQELAAHTTTRQRELQRDKSSANDLIRNDFAYESKSGWTWALQELWRSPGRMVTVLGEGPVVRGQTRWSIAADSATWAAKGPWIMHDGATFMLPAKGDEQTFRFSTMRPRSLPEPPAALMNESKKAEEMTIGELREYIANLERGGALPGIFSVELYLKYAVPVACLIVALFGAPLAVTNPRAGAAVGLAIALGTTLVYLTGTQIMKAIGAKALVEPWFAAWSMNIVFLFFAIILLARVRS